MQIPEDAPCSLLLDVECADDGGLPDAFANRAVLERNLVAALHEFLAPALARLGCRLACVVSCEAFRRDHTRGGIVTKTSLHLTVHILTTSYSLSVGDDNRDHCFDSTSPSYAAFESWSMVGAIVRHWCLWLALHPQYGPHRPRSLFYLPASAARDTHGRFGCVIDTDIYTKNRQMRLYNCTKMGQQRPLERARALLVGENGVVERAVDLPFGNRAEEQEVYALTMAARPDLAARVPLLGVANGRVGYLLGVTHDVARHKPPESTSVTLERLVLNSLLCRCGSAAPCPTGGDVCQAIGSHWLRAHMVDSFGASETTWQPPLGQGRAGSVGELSAVFWRAARGESPRLPSVMSGKALFSLLSQYTPLASSALPREMAGGASLPLARLLLGTFERWEVARPLAAMQGLQKTCVTAASGTALLRVEYPLSCYTVVPNLDFFYRAIYCDGTKPGLSFVAHEVMAAASHGLCRGATDSARAVSAATRPRQAVTVQRCRALSSGRLERVPGALLSRH